MGWILVFYFLIALSLFSTRARASGLLGFVASVYVYPLILLARAGIFIALYPTLSGQPGKLGAFERVVNGGNLIELVVWGLFLLPFWRKPPLDDGVHLDAVHYP